MRAPSDKHFVHGGIFLLSNKLQTVGDQFTGDITTKQWFLLLAINGMEGRPSITEIAHEFETTRQNAAKLLGQLQKKGYVVIVPSAKDRRSQEVSVTPKAGDFLREISAVGVQFIEELFSGVEESEIECVAHVFRQMFENLSQMDGKQTRIE